MDQLIIPKLIFFFILITYLIGILLILSGEILSWSLTGVKGVTKIMAAIFDLNCKEMRVREIKEIKHGRSDKRSLAYNVSSP